MSSLGVQTIPEMYGCLLGWIQYQHAWTLLVNTGLVLLPFMGTLITHGLGVYLKHGAAGAALSLRAVSLHGARQLVIIGLAGVPCLPLSLHLIPLTSGQALAHPGVTGTTYDQVFFAVSQQHPRVPVLWYGVMATAEGLTAALRAAVGSVADLRGLITLVNLTTISSPQLRWQLRQFEVQCYAPAYQRYLRRTVDLSAPPQDTDWLGSHYFRRVPGYYDQLRAHQALPGFPFDPRVDWVEGQLTSPRWGKPLCRDWWQDPDVGLQAQLLAQLPAKTQAELRQAGLAPAERPLVDQALIQLLHHAPNGYAPANTLVPDLSITHALTALGVMAQGVRHYPTLYALEQGAPVLRALLLLLCYAMLPFGLVLGGYAARGLLTGSVLLLSLILWSYLWQLVQWIDSALMQALYQGWWFQHTPQALLTDILVGTLMVIAPVFWFTVMGSLGVAASQGMDRLLASFTAPLVASGQVGSRVIARVIR